MQTHDYPITNPCCEIFLPNSMLKEITIIESDAMVDGEKWYTVIAGRESSAWLRQQERGLWYETHGKFNVNLFDVHGELLVMLRLKWAA